MSAFRSAASLLVVLAAVAAAEPRRVQADTPPAPEISATQQAILDYVRDPNSNGRRLLDAARQQTGELSPLHEILIGDAESRAGLYRTAAIWYADARDRTAVGLLIGVAEFGLAWSALGRGAIDEARDHLTAAVAADVAQKPTLDFAAALLAAGNAFMSFAIANPDSRFTDDALYAAAVAKQQTGRDSEAREELEALAGDTHARGRVPTRLMELDPRAVLREGMRRDRERPIRTGQRRVTDLLDGDGVRLAQAALNRGEDAQDPGRPAKHHRHVPGARAAAGATPSDIAAAPTETATGSAPIRSRGTPGTPAPARDHRYPWSTLAVVVLFAVVASYLLARRAQQRTPGQRR